MTNLAFKVRRGVSMTLLTIVLLIVDVSDLIGKDILSFETVLVLSSVSNNNLLLS